MRRAMFRMAGVVSLAVLTFGLGGCKSVSKADYQAAVQEASELRERNGQLEQSNRDKDARIADLESRGAAPQQPVGAPSYSMPVDTGAGAQQSWPSENDPFQVGKDGRLAAELAGDVLFASGQATIKGDAKKQLDKIAKILNSKYANKSIRIEGHTDGDPIKHSKWGTNQALSEARAEAVKQYLSTKGVKSSRVSTAGMGATQPKASKSTSRRVEIVVLTN